MFVFKRDMDVKALVLFLFEDFSCKLVALVFTASSAEHTSTRRQ